MMARSPLWWMCRKVCAQLPQLALRLPLLAFLETVDLQGAPVNSRLDIGARCRDIIRDLIAPTDARTGLAHWGDQDESVDDHLLTTSALVCCLAHSHPQRDQLRLAALIHDLPDNRRSALLSQAETEVGPWVEMLRRQGSLLDRGEEIAPSGSMREEERILTLAHLAASRRSTVYTREDFRSHPLASAGKVDLVYGGAVRIKGYVFESAKLPEIRGASALLDLVNRLDLPALWGRMPEGAQDKRITVAQQDRYEATRAWLTAELACEPLDAPECVLYASGGNILALAPAGLGSRLAELIGQRYTATTLVAHSVGVAQQFSLLELQYGRAPQAFWTGDAQAILQGDPEAARLFQQSGGGIDPAAVKGFGELVTALVSRANRRRAGNAVDGGAPPTTPFIELDSHARKCTSCDIRPAAEEDATRGEFFCEPCRIKRDAGLQAKKGRGSSDVLRAIRPWDDWLEEQTGRQVAATTDDLRGLGQAARRSAKTFVGLIYADGNSVGKHVAGLRSIGAYRRFAQQMLAANEGAVAAALVEHIEPASPDGVWPCEIITIGGDDVLLFVPADHALEIARSIAAKFGEDMAETKITLSAGVLIMDETTPVRFGRDIVEQLLKTAKERSKLDKVGATVDFMALKSTPMIADTIAGYRSIAFQRSVPRRGTETHTVLSLTQRPYTLAELATLLDACRLLQSSNFPRSQLYQLRQLVEGGRLLQSAVDYRYFVERGKRRSRDGAVDPYVAFDQALQQLCAGGAWLPWRRREANAQAEAHRFDTPLFDLIELYPFIAGGRSAGDDA